MNIEYADIKTRKTFQKKDNYSPISLMNTENISKLNQAIYKIPHDQTGFTSGMKVWFNI